MSCTSSALSAFTSPNEASARASSRLVGDTRAKPGNGSPAGPLAMSSAVIVVPTTGIPASVSLFTAALFCVLLIATPDTARSWSGASVIVRSRATTGSHCRLLLPVLASTTRICGTCPLAWWLARYCAANAPWSSCRTFVRMDVSVEVSGSSSATVAYPPALSERFSRPIAAATEVSCGCSKS